MNNRPYEISNDINSVLMESSVSDSKSEFTLNINTTVKSSRFQPSMMSSFRSLKAMPIDTIVTKSPKRRRRLLILSIFTIVLVLSVILLYKLLSSISLREIDDDDSILLSLTSSLKERKKVALDNKAVLTTIVDDECDKVHFSISVNTNGMKNDVINEGLIYKEMALNYMVMIPFKKYESRNKERIVIFNITKYEITNGYSRVDLEIDSNKFSELMNFWQYWLNTYQSKLNDQATLRNLFMVSVVNSLMMDNDDIDKDQFYSRKNNDDYIEERIIDDVIFNNSAISSILAEFAKNNIMNDNITAIKENLSKAISNFYVGENINLLLYAKSSLIEDAATALSRAIKKLNSSGNQTEIEISTHNTKFSKGKIIWLKSNNIGRYISLFYLITNITNVNDIIYLDYLSYHLQSKRNQTLFDRLSSSGDIEDLWCKLTPMKQIENNFLLKVKLRLTTQGAFNIEDIVINITSYIKTFNSLKPKSEIEYKDFVIFRKNKIIFKEPNVYDVIDEYQNLYINKVSYKDYDTFKISNHPRLGINKHFSLENIILFYESKSNRLSSINIFNIDSEQIKQNTSIYIDDHNSTIVYYHSEISRQIAEKGFKNNTVSLFSKKSLPDISLQNIFMTKVNSVIECTDEKEKSQMEPSLIFSTNETKIWLRQDRSFLLPKVVANFHFVSTFIRSANDKEYFAHVLFYNQLQKRILVQLNDAIRAGNSIDMHLTDNGFHMKIVAFSDIISRIINAIFDIYFTPELSQYNYAKTRIEDFNYISYYTLKQRGISIFRRLLKFNKFYFVNDIPFNSKEVKLSIEKIPYHSLVTMLFYGDTNKTTVLSNVALYLNRISSNDSSFDYILNDVQYESSIQFLQALHFNVPINGSVIVRKANNDDEQSKSIVMNYYRIVNTTGLAKVKTMILLNLLKEHINKMFDFEFNIIDTDGFIYLYIGGESETKSPSVMNKEIDMKVKTFQSALSTITQKEFNNIKARYSYRSKLIFDSLDTKAKAVWKQIYLNSYQFSPSATSSLIVSLEMENILQMYNSLFIDKETIRKVSIQLYRHDLPFPQEKEEIYLPNKNITTEITEDIDIFHSRYHNL